MRRRRSTRERRRAWVVIGAMTIGFLGLLAQPGLAIPITITDDAGPDDESGQKDLNQLTVDLAPAGSDLEVTWNWDVISVSGANTGDACSLYDTDGDGNANYSLCVIWDNGSTYQTTRLYVCGDGAADKCDQPRALLAEDMNGDGDLADAGEALVSGPYASTCSLAVVSDTFGVRGGAQANTDFDTQASCQIELDDFGGMDAFLINVCSYPSQVPGSDPSDCVIAPNSGFLTIVKVADPDDPSTAFTFNLGAEQAATNGDTSFSIDGSGSVALIGFPADTDVDLTEVVPAGWQLDGVSCELSNGTATGTFSGTTMTDLEIQVGRETTCTFTNSLLATLTLEKVVVNDNGGTAIAADWTLSADGTDANDLSGTGPSVSASLEADTFTLSESGPGGYTASDWSCDGGTLTGDQLTLAPGDDVTCTITNDDDAASLILAKDVVNDNGGTAVEADWTLSAGGNEVTGSPGGVEATDQAGTYFLAETGPVGYTLTSLTCDDDPGVEVTSVTIGLGETITCVFVNDDDEPSLTLVKVVDNGANPGGTATPADFELIASGPTGFSGNGPTISNGGSFDAGSYDLSEDGPLGYLASDWVCDGGNQTDGDTVSIGLGQDVECTITNTAMGMTTLLKLTNGVESDMSWNFTLSGPGVDESDSSPPTTVDFGGVKLIPGEEYTLCETGIPAGWTLEWQVDTDGDGVPDTIIPIVAGVNNSPVGTEGYSNVYDPNYVPPPDTFTNDTRCVNFVVGVGETLAFQINNSFPGGEPRTIGFWKNWNTCTGGSQDETAANNGGPATGWFILDDLLNNPGYTIGVLQLDGADCEDAVNILDKRSIDDGRKRASDGAYNLASQLLAAQLNLSAGAETCQAVVDAVNAGQTLLAGIGFDGTGGYLRGRQAAEANALAAILDQYNNGDLCG